MFRRLKREIRFAIKALMEILERGQLRWDQYRCPHTWRPIRLNDKPARLCRICEKSETLTPELFFAYFGEVGGFNR